MALTALRQLHAVALFIERMMMCMLMCILMYLAGHIDVWWAAAVPDLVCVVQAAASFSGVLAHEMPSWPAAVDQLSRCVTATCTCTVCMRYSSGCMFIILA
jgi:hypothetical protein